MKSLTTGSMLPLTSITSMPPAGGVAPADAGHQSPRHKDAMASVETAGRDRIDEPPRKERVDPARFCSQTGLVIVAGKGGVGKTTVTAAFALMAARCGLSPETTWTRGACSASTTSM